MPTAGSAIHKTTFEPNPLQRGFIESRAEADLFSSRRGEGKSTGLAWSAMYHTRHNPGAKWAFVRDTWENMQATTMLTFFEWFPPGIYGTFHAGKKKFSWAEGVASGDVTFMGMDDPADASKLMSREIAGLAIDEPAPAVASVGIDEMIFDVGLSSLRQPDMKWYAAKLAENNPDESHWTYRRFVQPGNPNFRLWQPYQPENLAHLPQDYYAKLRTQWAHRPDLVRRFVEGEFGFQSQGKAVTPQWNDKIHLTLGLNPIPRRELILLWDFGHTPTCIITQVTPLGHWNILDCVTGEGVGTTELIADLVRPVLAQRYGIAPGKLTHTLRHIGDHAGKTPEQGTTQRSAVGYIRALLGGTWRSGPIKTYERVDPLQAVLSRTIGGRGVVQVDREFAAPVWWALRGGWHYHVARTGIISGEPAKTHPHSDVGDAMGYGAAILFPLRSLTKRPGQGMQPSQAIHFGTQNQGFQIGPGPKAVPEEGHIIKTPTVLETMRYGKGYENG